MSSTDHHSPAPAPPSTPNAASISVSSHLHSVNIPVSQGEQERRQKRNLTGIPRKLSDIVIGLFNASNQWRMLNLEGAELLLRVASKCPTMRDDGSSKPQTPTQEDIRQVHEMLVELEDRILHPLRALGLKFSIWEKQMSALGRLGDGESRVEDIIESCRLLNITKLMVPSRTPPLQSHEEPPFLSWTIKEVSDALCQLLHAYLDELKLKEGILKEIGHQGLTHGQGVAIWHLSIWTHEPILGSKEIQQLRRLLTEELMVE